MAAEVTQLLNAIEGGDPHAAEELLPLVYQELRRLAAARMAHESPGQTLQATALVHEAWLRISGPDQQRWENRRHFFAAAAEAMRRILIERARRRQRLRHGGQLQRVDFDEIDIAAPVSGDDDKLLRIHEALEALAVVDARRAEIVKLRFFVGLTGAETAEVLGINERTVDRQWSYAQSWLFQHIKRRERADASR